MENPTNAAAIQISPWHDLHEELLVEVAQYLVDPILEFWHSYRLLLGNMMVVCRRWRDIIQATPTLWRVMNVGIDPEWTILALTRSLPCTIDVSVPYEGNKRVPYLDVFEHLLHHTHRLRLLHISAYYNAAHVPSLLNLLDCDMPVLEDLALSPPEFPDDVDSVLDLALSAQRLPRLHTLVVMDAFAPPRDPLLYARLRKLTLDGCLFDGSMDEFVALLAHSTHLEELSLDMFLMNLTFEDEDEPPPRPLPCLEKVEIREESAGYLAAFFARVSLPSNVKLSVAMLVPRHDIPEGIAAFIPPEHALTLPVLGFLTEISLRLDSTQLSHSLHAIGENSSGSLNASLYFNTDAGSRTPELLASSANKRGWVKLFRALPHLKSLMVSGSHLIAVVFSSLAVASASNPPACPGLKSVQCRRAHHTVALFQALFECLDARAANGCPRLALLGLLMKVYEHEDFRQDIFAQYIPQLRCRVEWMMYDDGVEGREVRGQASDRAGDPSRHDTGEMMYTV